MTCGHSSAQAQTFAPRQLPKRSLASLLRGLQHRLLARHTKRPAIRQMGRSTQIVAHFKCSLTAQKLALSGNAAGSLPRNAPRARLPIETSRQQRHTGHTRPRGLYITCWHLGRACEAGAGKARSASVRAQSAPSFWRVVAFRYYGVELIFRRDHRKSRAVKLAVRCQKEILPGGSHGHALDRNFGHIIIHHPALRIYG